MRSRLALLAVLALGCSSGHTRVPFRVVLLGDDATLGATSIAVTLQHGSVRDPSTTVRFAPDERVLDIGPLPYDVDDVLVVETERSGLVLGRGRSLPFSVDASGASPHRPDVSLGVLGRFAALGATAPDPTSVIAPTADGALLASRTDVAHFLAHDGTGAPVLLPSTPWPADRVGGGAVALGGGVLVIGGTHAGASLVAADGHVLAELDASAVASLHGAALVALDASSVLAVGGMDETGTSRDDVVRIEWDGANLTAASLAPLPSVRTDARAVALDVHDRGGEVERAVLVLDGLGASGTASDVVLIDPAGGLAPLSVVVPAIASRPAICALDTGLVLLAGGVDDTGTVTDAVTILLVQRASSPPIQALAPSPPRLFHPRSEAATLMLGPGVALVVGGLDVAGAPIREAEILEVRLDFLPGDIALTGALAIAGPVTAAARLADQTVLVSSGGSLSLYFPPRGD